MTDKKIVSKKDSIVDMWDEKRGGCKKASLTIPKVYIRPEQGISVSSRLPILTQHGDLVELHLYVNYRTKKYTQDFIEEQFEEIRKKLPFLTEKIEGKAETKLSCFRNRDNETLDRSTMFHAERINLGAIYLDYIGPDNGREMLKILYEGSTGHSIDDALDELTEEQIGVTHGEYSPSTLS